MNYEIMSDFQINKQVADALDLNTVKYPHAADKRSVGVKHSEFHFEWFDYCNNPSDAWPIIAGNKIATLPWNQSDWQAFLSFGGADGIRFRTIHKNPLRAAMIVFLMINEKE